ncbi:hypothetical protein [Limobrevibacterium gyesilva]|uniref:Uncharacterized protein n=1 Tax=Limobrevibacterium gyesilva TaxID=2991712 RepID=A0AA41YYF6_9PROT|nr:hypothetical protein [Limobrevibacterium gyesilva]MCW3477552.1 hypothetical protein [Limobrevibacterium gyesilva]
MRDATQWAARPTGIGASIGGRETIKLAAAHAIDALSLDIRPSGFMWPRDKPFLWTPEECRAAVMGYQVKWKGDFDDFLKLLRGKWQMLDGYAFLHQP